MSKKHEGERFTESPELERFAQREAARQTELEIAINLPISAAAGVGGLELIKTSIDNLGNPLSIVGILAGIVFLGLAGEHAKAVIELTHRLHKIQNPTQNN
jgi:hypothetical protein